MISNNVIKHVVLIKTVVKLDVLGKNCLKCLREDNCKLAGR